MKVLLLIPLIFFSLLSYGQPTVKRVSINHKPYPYMKDSTILMDISRKNLFIEFYPPGGDSGQVAYRLLNLDTLWQVSSYPVLSLYGLSGGDYTLEVREVMPAIGEAATGSTLSSRAALPSSSVLSGSGALSGAVLRIPIQVQEAFWQKWWFWPSVVIYFLLLAGVGVYLFFLYDFRQKLKLHYVRNRIASDLHDEVGANLNSIAIFTELLRKKVANDASLLPILDRITSNSEETVTLMRDTVWAINPENDSTEKLVERMRAFGVEILAAKDIPFEFSVPDLKHSDGLSMEQRRSLYLVYKEAVNNIAKHSEAKNAECTLKKEGDVLKIRIRDDGRGFDPGATFEGNGLRNFASRGREENMRVSVTSRPGEGTTVTVEVWV